MSTSTEQVWPQVVHQASFLHERMALGWIADENQTNTEAVANRLKRWRQLLSAKSDADFERRLSWLGLQQASLVPLLGEGRLATWPTESTAWIEVLVAVLQQRKNYSFRWHDLTNDAINSHFFKPFLAVGWERLDRLAKPHLDLLSPQAKKQLTSYFLKRLTELAQPTLSYLGLSAYLSSDILNDLCHSYPVLIRQLSSNVAQWGVEVSQFLHRFTADWPALALQVGQAGQLTQGMVHGIRAGLSDPHYGGCTVWRIDLGAKAVAYKPKNIEQNQAWNHLIQWCNEQDLATPLTHLCTLPRIHYGWMAWAHAEERSTENDHATYHHQLGMMLSLLTLLHASDVHQENIVVQAGAPILIDAEMIPYPQIMGLAAMDKLDVLRTGLLPRWRRELGGYGEIGTLSHQIDPVFYDSTALQRGYQAMNRFLRQNWAKLSRPNGPLKHFRKGKVRFAPRPTAAYHRLLTHLRHPACLGNGIAFSIEADRLAVTFLQNEQYGCFWPLLSQEQRAIAQGDVPVFHVEVGQPDLLLPSTQIKNCFVWPSFQCPTLQDERLMLGLLKASVDRTSYLRKSTSSGFFFLEQAIGFGQQLLERAIYDQNGAANWVANRYQAQSRLYQHQFLDDDFYAGRAGIALFLAALSQVDSAKQWYDLAQAAIRPFSGQTIPASANGGRIYALSQIGQWLGKSLIDSVSTPDKTEPQEMGIIAGQAGLLLGWLNGWYCSLQPSNLNQAIRHGEVLLAHTEKWTDEANTLGGFAHGAAGIAYALTKLYEACGQTKFLNAARQGWAFQRTLYDAPPGYWQDRRSYPAIYLENWCHGAAGIGLAALGCLDALPDLQDIVERVRAILSQRNNPSALDTLCCGQFGQIDALLEIGLCLNHDDSVNHAANLAQTIATNAAKRGYFQLYDDIPANIFNPTFFRGVAGIGYTFLRLATARGEIDARFPCALGWAVDS